MNRKITISLIFFVLACCTHASTDDWNVQGTMRQEGEEEGDENRDLQFDLEMSSKADRPPRSDRLPKAEKVQEILDKEKDRLIEEAEAAGDNSLRNVTITVKKGFQYYNLFDLKKHVLQCCPSWWKYQCRGIDIRMPCFYSYYNNQWEWCCPIWPRVLLRKCMCRQCAVLTSTCAHEGTCQRRYSRRGCVAVCYRQGAWAYLRYIVKWIPTSCYCRI